MIVAIVLTVLMTLKSTPQITAETRDLSISFFILSLFIIVIFAVWDLIIRVRKGGVCFCCNKANIIQLLVIYSEYDFIEIIIMILHIGMRILFMKW